MTEIIWISIDKIKPNDYNPNVMSADKFEALCDFLKTHSAEEVDPIWVRKNGFDSYEVIDGEHRWRAAKTVGWNKLKAFILDADAEKAKTFNVRKNRERGQLDIFKLGKLMKEDRDRGSTCDEINKKYGYITTKGAGSRASEYITVYENKDLIQSNIVQTRTKRISLYKALQILHDLKHPEPEEPISESSTVTESEPQTESPEETDEEGQNLREFLTNYKEALEKIPEDTPKPDDVKIAIDFFKKLLTEKKVVCPVCGEAHLQWRCGHDF